MSVQSDLKIRVDCVVEEYDDTIETPQVQKIKEQAFQYGIPVSTRLYDARNISVDREEVAKLPAFHIFVEHDHITTFYIDARDPTIHLEEGIDFYRKRQQLRKARAKMWTNVLNWFSGCGNTKNKSQ
jgi:hypothetical protein